MGVLKARRKPECRARTLKSDTYTPARCELLLPTQLRGNSNTYSSSKSSYSLKEEPPGSLGSPYAPGCAHPTLLENLGVMAWQKYGVSGAKHGAYPGTSVDPPRTLFKTVVGSSVPEMPARKATFDDIMSRLRRLLCPPCASPEEGCHDMAVCKIHDDGTVTSPKITSSVARLTAVVRTHTWALGLLHELMAILS